MPLGEAPQRDVRERTDEVDVPDQRQRRRGGGQPLSASCTPCPCGEEKQRSSTKSSRRGRSTRRKTFAVGESPAS